MAASINTEQLKKNVTTGRTWLRLLFMILFGIFFSVGSWVVGIIALFQFLHALFSGAPNRRLMPFSGSLGSYLGQAARYVTYQTEIKPFPFADWPAPPPSERPVDAAPQPPP